RLGTQDPISSPFPYTTLFRSLRVVIGPNGAGKSTMLDLITGRTKPDKGKIEFGRDTDLTALNEYQINRLGIGRKFQTPSVYIDRSEEHTSELQSRFDLVCRLL